MKSSFFPQSLQVVHILLWFTLLPSAFSQTLETPNISRGEILANDVTLLGKPPYKQVRFVEWEEGKDFEEFLSNYRGKVVYVDIWASWCRPCLAEIPYAQELKVEFANEEVAFLNISVDTDEQAWLKTIDRFEIAGDHIRLDEKRRNPFQDTYNIKGYPTYLIFDKTGKLVKNNAGWPSEKSTIKSIQKRL